MIRTFVAACAAALALLLPGAARADLPAPLAARIEQIYRAGAFGTRGLGPAQWLDQGSAYAVLEFGAGGAGGAASLVQVRTASGERSPMIAAEAMPRYPTAFWVDPHGRSILIAAHVHASADRQNLVEYWLYDRQLDTIARIAADVEDPHPELAFSPDGGRLLYVVGHNLVVHDIVGGGDVQLTSDGVPGAIGNGVADWTSGGPPRWSPDGRSVAFVQVDERGVGQYPILNQTDAVYPRPWLQRFAVVGTPIAVMRVGIVPAAGGAVRWLAVPRDPAGDYLEGLEWDQASGALLFQRQSRSHDRVELDRADPATGAITTVVTEQDRAWVRDNFATVFTYRALDHGRAFLWVSERDGWRRAYRVSADGKVSAPITPAGVDVIAPVRVDDAGGYFYYIAAPDDAAQRLLYRTRLDGRGAAERVTPAAVGGTNRYDISPDGHWAIHTHSDAVHAPVIELVALPGGATVRTLEDNARAQAAFSAWAPRPPQFVKLPLAGGVTLDAWVMRPKDFDPARRYPVLVYVYGEPAAQTVLDSWEEPNMLINQAMAEAGYIVVSIDNRGTPAPKGSAWRRAVFGALGPLSTAEQAAGLRVLATLEPAIDLARVGIWGWSAGGTNTLNALFREPDLYSVGVAVVPKPRPDLYNAWYQEVFMRTPAENPDGYKRSAPINYAEGLKGHLLIISGTGEENTHFANPELLINRLVELNKPFDFMEYPNRDHGMAGTATQVHLFETMARYFTEHLPVDAGR